MGEKKGRARAEAVLDIFQHCRITYAMFTPELLRQMKVILLGKDAQLDNGTKSTWMERFGTVSVIRCATGVVEPSTRQFWTDLTACPFENNYGSTELGGGATAGISKMQVRITLARRAYMPTTNMLS
jgi:malonyl-CoA/methylmalonyl-CoA synthetase